MTTQKDPDTAFLIELVGGFFGFLGLGYLWIGQTNDGLIRLIVWLIYNVVAWVAIGILMIVSLGCIGCFCAPVQILIQIGIPIWSASTLKNMMTGGPTKTKNTFM
jgi:hypothetical protein